MKYSLVFALLPVLIAPWPAAGSDWPTFRHDPQLTGRYPHPGQFTGPPATSWRIDLGAAVTPSEKLRNVDLDSDGSDEILAIREDSLACLNRNGTLRWETDDLPAVQVLEIRDFAGRGPRGIFASTSDGLETTRWMISGATGNAARLYSMRDVFGAEERIGKILPDVPGEQICAWWSGDSPDGRFGDVMVAEGFIFSFENGIASPARPFEQRLEGTLYKPRHFFSDYDGDGNTEMVMVSHQQAWFYDVASNALELQVRWPMIRTYLATLAMVPPGPDRAPALYSINPHIPGAERVDIVDDEARVAWRYIAGGRADQYQTDVKVWPGAPDPYAPVLAGNATAVFVNIENEHGDGRTWLAVLDGETGEKLFEAPHVTILGYDDLDGDGVLEILIREGSAFRITRWNDNQFQDIWRREDVEPVFAPVPAGGDLGRSNGANAPLQRSLDGTGFLLRFDGGIYAYTLGPDGLSRQVRQPAVAASPKRAPAETVVVADNVAIVSRDGAEVYRYEPALERRYLAPPAIAGDLGGQRRVLARNDVGNLVSYAADGSDPTVLAYGVFGEWSICDMDGDGENEVVAGSLAADGSPGCVILSPQGEVEHRFGLIENATAMKIGPTGSLGEGRGRWLAIYYERGTGNRNGVAAYGGKTGEMLWLRDDYQSDSNTYGEGTKVKFVLHVPTAVLDYDGDGSDDLLAASENFYGIMSVAGNKDITPIQVFSDYIPGHWQAYAHPIAADFSGLGRPQVFHHKAFANTILTDLEGQPIWHWGASRDQTASSWPGIADLDGNGSLEIVQTRVDGRLRAFDATPGDTTCPKCPPDAERSAMNHSGVVRWEQSFPPPVSDLAAADVNGDGREEVLFGAGDGKLYALGETNGAPQVLWTRDLGSAAGSPIIADVDLDGIPEILVPSADGYLHCLTNQ